jgi:hypothetical protein
MTEPGTLLELIRHVRAQRRTTDALEGELRLEGSLIEFVEGVSTPRRPVRPGVRRPLCGEH